MSTIDDVIRTDFEALADRTAHAAGGDAPIRELLLGAAGPYRDDAPGAEARRRHLFEGRLRELALMPLACERIFVHRASRAAAGAVALLGVAFAAVASIDAWTHRLVYMLFGQPTAALSAALLGGTALAAYVVAGLIAERYYERRMRAQVEIDGEPQRQIDQLAGPGPTDEARRLIDRLDAAALALPLAGAVAGGLLLGLLAFFSDPGFSALALIAESRHIMLPALIAALAAGILLSRAAARDRRGESSWLFELASHWLTLAAGGVATAAALWLGARTAFGLHAMGIIPSSTTELVLGGFGLAALLLPASWLLLWLRRREYRRLGD